MQVLRVLENVFLREVVVLREVTDDLGGGHDLDDVAVELVGLDVFPLDLLPLRAETELLCPELYNCVYASASSQGCLTVGVTMRFVY